MRTLTTQLVKLFSAENDAAMRWDEAAVPSCFIHRLLTKPRSGAQNWRKASVLLNGIHQPALKMSQEQRPWNQRATKKLGVPFFLKSDPA